MSIGPNPLSRPLTRRQAFGISGALGLGAFLASCAGSGQTGTTSTTSANASPSTASPSPASGAPSSSATGPTSASGTAVVLDDSTGQTLDALFDKVFAATGVAGMAAGVWIGADSWLRSAGYADLTTKEPFRPADHVRIASITKSYTATAVLQLVDQGEIALTDTHWNRSFPG